MTQIRQAVILAGGKGTRLKDISGDLPKPLVPIEGQPVIVHQLRLLAEQGIQNVVLLTGYRGDLVAETLGDGRAFGLQLHYEQELSPLGTAGALLTAYAALAERFFVFYGDTLVNMDLSRFEAFHQQRRAAISLMVHPNSHPFDSDIITYDSDFRVKSFHGYPHPEGAELPNSVNAGLYIVEKVALQQAAEAPLKEDLCKHLFPRLQREGQAIFAYPSREYIKDMGTSQRFAQVAADIRSGKVAQGSLRSPCPVLFFDRDGTLTTSLDYVRSPAELQLYPEAAAALKLASRAAFINVLVTNQPVVARGEVSEEGLEQIHAALEWRLGREGAFLDRLYACPHHPDRGFPGEIAALKGPCSCRKPATGLIDRAMQDLNFDREASWMIGDTTTDVKTAAQAGLKSVLVRTGYAGADGKYPVVADFEAYDVLDAVRFITEDFAALMGQARELAPQVLPHKLVLIGGLARSGKSSWASCLRFALQELGLTATTISLDSWLRAKDGRAAGVEGRYDLAGAEDFILRLLASAEGSVWQLPQYDRQARAQRLQPISCSKGAIVIVEGVPAMLLREFSGIPVLRICVTIEEEQRKARFVREYRSRGATSEEIHKVYAQREDDEHASIRTAGALAQLNVDLTR